jgi:hypothetical protein
VYGASLWPPGETGNASLDCEGEDTPGGQRVAKKMRKDTGHPPSRFQKVANSNCILRKKHQHFPVIGNDGVVEQSGGLSPFPDIFDGCRRQARPSGLDAIQYPFSRRQAMRENFPRFPLHGTAIFVCFIAHLAFVLIQCQISRQSDAILAEEIMRIQQEERR